MIGETADGAALSATGGAATLAAVVLAAAVLVAGLLAAATFGAAALGSAAAAAAGSAFLRVRATVFLDDGPAFFSPSSARARMASSAPRSLMWLFTLMFRLLSLST